MVNRVIEAASGQAGLELARKQLPDLIITDISMPGMSGQDVLKQIRQDPELSGRQVVLMTGDPRIVTPRRGMEEGADDFLVKPVSMADLLRCVEARLKRSQTQLAGGRQHLQPVAVLAALHPAARIYHSPGRNHRDHGRPAIEFQFADGAGNSRPLPGCPPVGLALAPDPQKLPVIARSRSCEPEDAAVAGCASSQGRSRKISLPVPGRRSNAIIGWMMSPFGWMNAPFSPGAGDLSLIVEELVDNACKFSRQGTPVIIRLGTDGVLTVIDAGARHDPGGDRANRGFPSVRPEKTGAAGTGSGPLSRAKINHPKWGDPSPSKAAPPKGPRSIIAFQVDSAGSNSPPSRRAHESTLSILHLEDDPKEVEIVQDILETGGVSCSITSVQNKSDFIRELERSDIDLIISDYSLPGFDGLSALKMTRYKWPDLPFILVSGTVGEEFAIDSLKSGATDYVLKDRRSRIVPAVRRAMQEVEEREKRRRLEEQFIQAQKMEVVGQHLQRHRARFQQHSRHHHRQQRLHDRKARGNQSAAPECRGNPDRFGARRRDDPAAPRLQPQPGRATRRARPQRGDPGHG